MAGAMVTEQRQQQEAKPERAWRRNKRVAAALVTTCFVGAFNVVTGVSALRSPGLAVEAAGFLVFGALMIGLAVLTYAVGSAVPVAIAAALILGQGVIDLFTGSWGGEQAAIRIGALLGRILLFVLLIRGYRALK